MGERERNIIVWLLLLLLLLGTWPTAQAWALTGNRSGGPSVLQPALNHWATNQPGLDTWNLENQLPWAALGLHTVWAGSLPVGKAMTRPCGFDSGMGLSLPAASPFKGHSTKGPEGNPQQPGSSTECPYWKVTDHSYPGLKLKPAGRGRSR